MAFLHSSTKLRLQFASYSTEWLAYKLRLMVEISEKWVYNKKARQIKNAKQERSAANTPPPAYGEAPPYTTVFTAHCRYYYTSFPFFCTGGGRVLLMHNGAVYGNQIPYTAFFLVLRAGAKRLSSRRERENPLPPFRSGEGHPVSVRRRQECLSVFFLEKAGLKILLW